MNLEQAERLADLLIKRKALDKACVPSMARQEDMVTLTMALAEVEAELRQRLLWHVSQRRPGLMID